MQSDSNFKQALKVSYQLLSYRPRSVYEIRAKLKEKDCAPEVIDRVIEHLKKHRYLNDKDFARFWVEAKMKVKPVGSLLLKRDLKQKGLDEALVEETVKGSQADYDEFEVALNLAKRRLNYYGKIHKLKAKKRIYDYLIRRGFKFDITRNVLGELFKR